MSGALHWSKLRFMRQSPAHYQHFSRVPFTMTPAMKLGWLAHALVLGGEGPVVWEGQRRGKAWLEFKEQHDPDRIVTASEMATAENIADAVQANPEARCVLEDGVPERTMEWAVAGRVCAGRTDVAGLGLTELKVTDCDPAKFPWHARRMGWHGQLAWYGEGARIAHGVEFDRYSVVAVEPKPPHAVCVYDLSERTTEEGTRLWRSLFDRLLVCEASDEWPGYSQTILPWDVPEEDEVTLIIGGKETEVA